MPLADQSIFVRAAVSGVIKEGVIAAALTSLMILLFLGSWRSTLVIVISIPLAILFSVALLSALGQTLNIMTLGGLALAVGILVDDATVTIENINWHLEKGKPVQQAILDGAQQIVMPAFVSLLCICIAFVPMFFLPGISGFLFAPMAEAVLFAHDRLLPAVAHPGADHGQLSAGGAWRRSKDRAVARSHDAGRGPSSAETALVRFQHGFEKRFEKVRAGYHRYAESGDGQSQALSPAAFWLSRCCRCCWCRSWAAISFRRWMPARSRLHVRAPIGTRIEETAALFDHIEKPHPRRDPARRTGLHRRQYRPAGQSAPTAPISTPAAWGRRTATS